eukprot:COSAG02_NODE_355_length_24011_cov_28.560932_7_plen_157_part_00
MCCGSCCLRLWCLIACAALQMRAALSQWEQSPAPSGMVCGVRGTPRRDTDGPMRRKPFVLVRRHLEVGRPRGRPMPPSNYALTHAPRALMQVGLRCGVAFFPHSTVRCSLFVRRTIRSTRSCQAPSRAACLRQEVSQLSKLREACHHHPAMSRHCS